MADRSVVVGFLLGENPVDLQEFLNDCRDKGQTPVVVRAIYEVALPDHPDAATIKSPMDYLSPADTDAIYADIERMQRRMPALRLRSGITVGEWAAADGAPPTVWTWLPALVPYWHVTLRLIRTVRRVLETERPMSVVLVGSDELSEWCRRVIERTLARYHVGIDQAPRGSVLAFQAAGDLGIAQTIEKSANPTARRRVLATLAARQSDLDRRAADQFKRHVVLLMRGLRGTNWLSNRSNGQAALIDDYSEGMPEALIEVCREVGARLTIVYEGVGPEFTVGRPSYSKRYPSFVSELTSDEFTGIAGSMRAAVRTRFESGSQALLADPEFREMFRLDGVDAFEPFEDYIRRSISNMATTAVTQYEAWKVFFEEYRPDTVIGGRLEMKPWVSRAAHEVAATTISIKLGIGEEMMPSMIAIDQNGRYAHMDYPDGFLVWGERQRDYLTARLPEYHGTIRAVGRARSDSFVREGQAIDPIVQRGLLGVPAGARVIVYGANHRSRYGQWPNIRWGSSCFSRESYVAGFRALLAVARELGDGFLLVKPHRADDIHFIADLVAREGGSDTLLVTSEMGFHNVEILAAADVFVSTVSSMFAEAAVMGRVSINIWRPDVNLLYEKERWARYSAIAAPAESFVEMQNILRRFLTEPLAYRAELERVLTNIPEYFGGLDGDNARRAARAALDIEPVAWKTDSRRFPPCSAEHPFPVYRFADGVGVAPQESHG